MIHQPNVNNELVDYLSRNRPDPTGWHLSPLIAQCLFQMWGRPQVDLLTSHQYHQLPLWFYWTGQPSAAASNTLSLPWTELHLYAYPPIPLLERTLIKIREDQVEEAIVRGDPGTTFSRWHVRSPSCYHADRISCHNACAIWACSTTPTWRPSS